MMKNNTIEYIGVINDRGGRQNNYSKNTNRKSIFIVLKGSTTALAGFK